MAPFRSSTSETVGHRSGGRFLLRLHAHAPRIIRVSIEHPPPSSANHTSYPCAESSYTPRSSLGIVLSRFHRGRRGARDQPALIPNPGQIDAGMAEPSPLESEPGPPFSTQPNLQNCDTEMVRQDVAWLVNQLASPGTRASARSSKDKSSSLSSCEDDANSDHTLLISDDDDDVEDVHHYIILGAYNVGLNQPVYIVGMCDTGAAVSILSYAKARLVAPDGVSDNFSHVGERTVDTIGGTVTVHGPIWVKFCLRNKGGCTRCLTPFYVLPSRYGEWAFDALLNFKLVRRLGLLGTQPDSPTARGAAASRSRRNVSWAFLNPRWLCS